MDKNETAPAFTVYRSEHASAHPLWSGQHPDRLVRDRQWRRDIPMATADGVAEPSFVNGIAGLARPAAT